MIARILLRSCLWVLGLVVVVLPSYVRDAKADEEIKGPITIELGDGFVDFKIGPRLVTRYVVKQSAAKPYFWPLNSPTGLAVTRGWPMEKGVPGEQTDHVHQKSAWFCYGDVVPEGFDLKEKVKGVEGVDFWAEGKGHGTIACTKLGTPTVDKNHAFLETRNEWRTSSEVNIMDEKRTIHLYDLGATQLLVLDIDLHASVTGITFADTKEGALGVRVRDSVTTEKGKGTLTNADGKLGEGRANNIAKTGCWGLKSAWCDYSGPVDGKEAGIAIFADPSNPSPSCWHARGYGLMAANPFGRGKSGFPDMAGTKDLVKLAKGDHLKMRFGILLHDGNVKDGQVAEAYRTFVKLGKKE